MAYTTPRTWNNEVISDAKLNQDLRDNVLDILASLHGDTSSTSAVLHAHKNGTFANRPAAGLAGREYYATDMGVVFIDNGTRWDVMAVNKRIASVFEDEFELSNLATTITTLPAGLNWAITPTSSAGGRNALNAGFSRMQLFTGATSGSQVTFSTQVGGTTYLMDQASDRVPALWSSRFATSATTNQTAMAGLSVPNPIQDGIYFKRVDTASVGNWVGVCRSGGVETTTTLATGVVVGDTSQHWFEIEINALNSVKFYIDGTQVTPTISTNIPTLVNLNPQYYIVNAAAADKQLNLDFIQWIAKR